MSIVYPVIAKNSTKRTWVCPSERLRGAPLNKWAEPYVPKEASTQGEVLRHPIRFQQTAFRSLGEGHTHVRFCNKYVYSPYSLNANKNLLQCHAGDLLHLHVAICVKFSLQLLLVHTSQATKDWPFVPGRIMFPETPSHSCKSIRVSPVQLILMVQVKSISKRLFRDSCPSGVSRSWRAFALQSHRSETFELSKAPLFIEKVRDILGLYSGPSRVGIRY